MERRSAATVSISTCSGSVDSAPRYRMRSSPDGAGDPSRETSSGTASRICVRSFFCSSRSSFRKARVGYSILCWSARWPCTPRSPLPIGFAGIRPRSLVPHPFKPPFAPISRIAESQLFEIWEYYLILERGWVGGWLLSAYVSLKKDMKIFVNDLCIIPLMVKKFCPQQSDRLLRTLSRENELINRLTPSHA